MVRLNITMSEELFQGIRGVKNKSRYIAEALRERLHKERKKELEKLLIEGYKKSVKEEHELNKDWDITTGDGIE